MFILTDSYNCGLEFNSKHRKVQIKVYLEEDKSSRTKDFLNYFIEIAAHRRWNREITFCMSALTSVSYKTQGLSIEHMVMQMQTKSRQSDVPITSTTLSISQGIYSV